MPEVMTETYIVCEFVTGVLGPNATPQHYEFVAREVCDWLRQRDLRGGPISSEHWGPIKGDVLDSFFAEFGGHL